MGIFRNKSVRNQLFLSLLFLIFTGVIAFVFDRKAGVFVLFSGTGLCIFQTVFAEKRYKEIRFYPSSWTKFSMREVVWSFVIFVREM